MDTSKCISDGFGIITLDMNDLAVVDIQCDLGSGFELT